MTGGTHDQRRTEFDEFYRKWFTLLAHEARRQLPAPESEDVVQEVLARMWKLWGEIEGPRVSYARRAIKNLVNERRRQASESIPVEHPQDSALMARVENVETRENMEDLLARIAELPRRLREVALLHLYGFDTGEIAERMGCRKASVSTYRWQARQLLAEKHPEADRKGRARGIRNDDRGDA